MLTALCNYLLFLNHLMLQLLNHTSDHFCDCSIVNLKHPKAWVRPLKNLEIDLKTMRLYSKIWSFLYLPSDFWTTKVRLFTFSSFSSTTKKTINCLKKQKQQQKKPHTACISPGSLRTSPGSLRTAVESCRICSLDSGTLKAFLAQAAS